MSNDQVIFAAVLILCLPLAGFLAQVILPVSWRGKERQGDWIPTGAMALAMLLALTIFYTKVVAHPRGLEQPIRSSFLLGCKASEDQVREGVRRTFLELDRNKDGFLDEDELGAPLAVRTGVPGKLSADELFDWRMRDEQRNVWMQPGEQLPLETRRLVEIDRKAGGGFVTIRGHGRKQLGSDPLGDGVWFVTVRAGGATDVVAIPQAEVRGEVRFPREDSPATPARGLGSTLRFDFGFLIDNLTAIMLVVVTVVSFLVHLYSTGYMRDHHGHPALRYGRFFAFLGLFTFSMLGLILTDNLFMLFVFWELVGVCSYFLIGFEFERPAAQAAQIKAFMTTRVGDVFFFLGIMVIGATVGSFKFDDIFASVPAGLWQPWLLTLTAILVFGGAMGKSAQFPLHVWLPDAMEGPTPVSALIHAATMVAAGVYLVARMFPFFAGLSFYQGIGTYFDSTALAFVAFTGGITAIFAATIALCQNDIKKVLAYSTVSQLGYMVLGIGVGSFSAGMFHLWTHAFFKALLFLGSGSVIHAVGTNDMRQMGGLRHKMPITFTTFLIATAAISGVPFLSGFYSKEAILTQAIAFGLYRGGIFMLPFVCGMITAGLTAFYMFRIIFMTFTGEPRNEERYHHAHESPWPMTVPLGVLCVFTVLSAGLFGIRSDWFHARVGNQTHAALMQEKYPEIAKVYKIEEALTEHEIKKEHGEEVKHGEAEHEEVEPYFVPPAGLSEADRERAEFIPKMLSLIAAACGISFCWACFAGPFRFEDLSPKGSLLGAYRRVLEKLYYLDDLYDWAFISPVMRWRLKFAKFDRAVIDRIVDAVGEGTVLACGLTERLDRKSLGMAKGAKLAFGAALLAGIALAVSALSGTGDYAVQLGGFGAVHVARGVRAAIVLGALLSALIGIVLAWTGTPRWNAAATSLLLAVSSIFGAEIGTHIERWSEGTFSTILYLQRLSTHPTLAAIGFVAGVGALVLWWAGLGVDGSVRWLSEKAVLSLGHLAQKLQTGRLQEYLFATVVGIVAIIFLVAIV